MTSFFVGRETAKWCETSKIKCWFSESTTSTNEQAKEVISQMQDSAIALWLTDHQTQGRGRGSHSWEDRGAGTALLSSWLFALARPPHPVATCRVGLALYRAALSSWPQLPWSLKAPNDLYLDTKKAGGLLIENIQQGSQNTLIVGLGLNVFSHPGLSTSTALSDFLSNEALPANEWRSFLDRLLLEFSLAISHSSELLHLNERLALTHALNACKGLQNTISNLQADGSFQMGKQIVNWQEL